MTQNESMQLAGLLGMLADSQSRPAQDPRQVVYLPDGSVRGPIDATLPPWVLEMQRREQVMPDDREIWRLVQEAGRI